MGRRAQTAGIVLRKAVVNVCGWVCTTHKYINTGKREKREKAKSFIEKKVKREEEKQRKKESEKKEYKKVEKQTNTTTG